MRLAFVGSTAKYPLNKHVKYFQPKLSPCVRDITRMCTRVNPNVKSDMSGMAKFLSAERLCK